MLTLNKNIFWKNYKAKSLQNNSLKALAENEQILKTFS